jgi:hypothetical protein
VNSAGSKWDVVDALALFAPAAWTEPLDQGVEIRHLMHGMFDKPGSPLEVDPIVVWGDYALAGWIQADTGGRALLRRKDGAWAIVLCSGDAIRTANALVKAGIPTGTADELARALAQAESKVSPDRLAMFSRFDGIMMIGEGNAHPQGQGHSGH